MKSSTLTGAELALEEGTVVETGLPGVHPEQPPTPQEAQPEAPAVGMVEGEDQVLPVDLEAVSPR
ncbi:MAG: hypothetical protein ACE5F1_20635 [Planctomycetota bacterium]